ncbi:lysophospholipid acyltransferase family protein [Zunongwangia endophytica]|uniref:Lysophospholipid acyltransferase family protein n=1 Tax=Zunongwangia endophytica TaxID=1808945 RepID=A0ABV8HG72_9FLAO|nr:lysophospholipid acyltransferase family protein [Zunongwangia endophytica]MDN3593969.1 lysophospholipid acyltransferase family protein [Zunongwangia endophytica]
MAGWSGKSRGTLFTIRIYVFIIRTFGLYPAYFLLAFIAFYFFLFAPTSFKSIYYYFRRRHGYNSLKSIWNIYKTYFEYGKVQLDRVLITGGAKERYKFKFDGISHIQNLQQQNKGGILLTAHIGNFNLAKHFFDQKHNNTVINLIISDFEHESIKNYMESVTGKSGVKLIVLKKDLSHIFKMNEALKNNELLVFAADRYMKEVKTWKADFLGATSQFPQGPFKLAVRNNISVLFVHIMRERNYEYHFYARPYIPQKNTPKELLKAYLENLEKMVKKYPHQWYNFYDYWKDFS